MFCEEFTDLLPHAGSMISCPDLLDVEEMDGIITITCNRSSALSLTLGAHAQRGLQ